MFWQGVAFSRIQKLRTSSKDLQPTKAAIGNVTMVSLLCTVQRYCLTHIDSITWYFKLFNDSWLYRAGPLWTCWKSTIGAPSSRDRGHKRDRHTSNVRGRGLPTSRAEKQQKETILSSWSRAKDSDTGSKPKTRSTFKSKSKFPSKARNESPSSVGKFSRIATSQKESTQARNKGQNQDETYTRQSANIARKEIQSEQDCQSRQVNAAQEPHRREAKAVQAVFFGLWVRCAPSCTSRSNSDPNPFVRLKQSGRVWRGILSKSTL